MTKSPTKIPAVEFDNMRRQALVTAYEMLPEAQHAAVHNFAKAIMARVKEKNDLMQLSMTGALEIAAAVGLFSAGSKERLGSMADKAYSEVEKHSV